MNEQPWAPRFFTIWIGQQLSWIGSRAGGFALVWWLTKETGSAQVLATATMGIIVPTVLLLDPVSFGKSGDVRGVAALLSDLEVAHYIVTRDLLDGTQSRPKPDHYDWWVLGTGHVFPKHALPDVAWRELS